MLSSTLSAIMKRQGMTNATLAEASGLSEATISKLRTGQNDSPSAQTLILLSDALDCTMDELLGREREQSDCAHNSKSCGSCPKHASMQEEFLEFYTEEIRKDIIETTNNRVAEYRRISEVRIADEKTHFAQLLEQNKEHYAQLSADKDALHQQRIDNLMRILDARAKTINRLSLICGAMAICLIALLILNIFFPTNPIIKW